MHVPIPIHTRTRTRTRTLQPYELKTPKMALDGAALAKLQKGLPVRLHARG